MPSYVFDDRICSGYDDVHIFLAKIDYTVKEESKYFYNGVNYSIIPMAKEEGQWKVITRREVPMELFEEMYNQGIYIDTEAENMEILKAVNFRMNRVMGNENSETNVNMENMTRGFRLGFSYYTKCLCVRPNYVIVFTNTSTDVKTGKGNYRATAIPFMKYVKDVFAKEWSLWATDTKKDEALKAGFICIQQYGVFYTCYYSKYPDRGYDLKTTTSDQVYGSKAL